MTAPKKSIKEHFTLAEIVKAVIVLGGALGLTAATSEAPAINERVAVLETRIDPLMGTLEDINTRLGIMQKTQDSLLIEIRIHMQEDRD